MKRACNACKPLKFWRARQDSNPPPLVRRLKEPGLCLLIDFWHVCCTPNAHPCPRALNKGAQALTIWFVGLAPIMPSAAAISLTRFSRLPRLRPHADRALPAGSVRTQRVAELPRKPQRSVSRCSAMRAEALAENATFSRETPQTRC